MAIKLHPSLHIPAGVWLKEEIVKPHGLTVTALAERLHVTRPALSNLLNGHSALSADMAIRFEKAFGISADTMMRMQTAYDLAKAREHADDLIVEPA